MAHDFESRLIPVSNENKSDDFESRLIPVRNEKRGFFEIDKDFKQTVPERIRSAQGDLLQIPAALLRAVISPYEAVAQRDIQGEELGVPTLGLPSLDKIEQFIEEKTGAPLTPTRKQELARLGINAATLRLGKMTPGGVLKKGAAGVAAPAISAGLEEAGVPKEIADFVGLASSQARVPSGTSNARNVPRLSHKVAPGQETTAKAIEESKLLPVRGATKPPSTATNMALEPYASKTTLKEHKEAVDTSVKNAVSKIIEEKIPITKLEKEGKDLKEIRSNLYNEVREAAKVVPGAIDVEPITNRMSEMVQQLRSIPSPGDRTRSLAKNLTRKIKDFHRKGFFSGEDIVNQYQEINDELSALFEKAKLTGLEYRKMKALREINQNLLEETAKQFESFAPEFASLFRSANKFNTQLENLMTTRSILDPIMEKEGGISHKSIKKALTNPKKVKELNKILGMENVNRIRRIGDYLQSVDNLYDMYKAPDLPTLVKQLSAKGLGYATIAAILGPTTTAVIGPAHFLAKYLRGKALLSSEGSRDLEATLKAIKQGDKKTFEIRAKELQKDFDEATEI